MKKQMQNVVVTLSIIATLAVAGFAALNRKVEANIPFEFMVNGKTLPAGQYSIEPSSTHTVLVVRSADTKQAAVVITRAGAVDRDAKPQLIFHRYGNQYFLAKVISATSENELMKSKAERKAARAAGDHLAKNEAAPEIVTISAQVGQ